MDNVEVSKLVDQVAKDFIAGLSEEDRKYVASGQNMMDMVGRAIRNEYNLWWDHPLTERWRTDESSRDIRDGVDFSVDHPDNISGTILKRAIELLNEKDQARFNIIPTENVNPSEK